MYTRATFLLLLAACSPTVSEILSADDVIDDTSELDPTLKTAAQNALDACFEGFLGTDPSPDYAQFAPTIGSHCYGTDHQDIDDIDRVVFLGDSAKVVVGERQPDQRAHAGPAQWSVLVVRGVGSEDARSFRAAAGLLSPGTSRRQNPGRDDPRW
ncbi:MAG: hypothetical protein ACI9MC_000962 [Kiritimatiellia bacterium]|jgi:hypothetical protein